MKTNEDLDDALNPHRAEELAAVNALVAERLRRRGIEATEDEEPDDLGDLLAAVERFEGLVEARGGDLMVDDLNSGEPDDPEFVLPAREPRERIRHYIKRIEAASELIRSHPSID
jgi:hypothetical protein